MNGFGAAWKPLAAGNPPHRMARYDIVCLHTMVGNLAGTYDYFKQNGWSGTESHFGVGGKWGRDVAAKLDGVVWQFVDTGYQADANLEGNPRIVSIETADNAPSTPAKIEAWTPKQFEALAQLVAHLCTAHDIPAVLIPDSKPFRRGIGYHRQGCEHSLGVGKVPGFLVAGGERWSTSRGKECPGPARIAQIPALIARVNVIMKPKEADVPLTPAEYAEIQKRSELGAYDGIKRFFTRPEAGILRDIGDHGADGSVAMSPPLRLLNIAARDAFAGRAVANDIRGLVKALVAAEAGDQIDETALAAALVPMLIPALPDLETAILQSLATATADEIDARERARLGTLTP